MKRVVVLLGCCLALVVLSLNAEEATFRRDDSYNENGQLETEHYYKQGQLWQTLQFVYDANGRLYSSSLFEDGVLKERITYFYNAEGVLWQTHKNDKLSFFTRNIIVNQLPQGLASLRLNGGLLTAINKQGVGVGNTQFFHNADGLLVRASFVMENNRLDEYYNQQGDRIRAVYYHDDIKVEEFSYTYNEQGLIQEERHWVADLPITLMRYFYNAQQQVVQINYYKGLEMVQQTFFNDTSREERYYSNDTLVYTEQLPSTTRGEN